MNPKTHKTVFLKSIWATGRPGSFMKMRQPVKQPLKTPGTMGSTFTIQSGRQKRSAGSQRCGSHASLVPAQQLVLHNSTSLLPAADPERQFLRDRACTLMGLWQTFFLFVCLLGVGFLGFVVSPPQMAFDRQAK